MALVTQAWLAVLVPVALMAGALAMQRFEYHLLGPAPHGDDESLDHRARTGRRPAGRSTTGAPRPNATEKPMAATTAPTASGPVQ